MSLDNTRLIARAAAQQAVNESKADLIGSGIFTGSTTGTTATVIGSIAIEPYSCGIIHAYCSGIDDSRNIHNVVKYMSYKHDGSTLTVPDTISAFTPTNEVAASVSFNPNGSNIDITVSGTGNMNWKVSYMISGVVNDAALA